MEITQAQAQALKEPRERPVKARFSKIYSEKSHIDCYQFYQKCEDYFKILGVTEMNCTPFVISFFRGTVSFRWAQQKRRHQSATLIIWSEFKIFFQKNLGNSQVFINNIWSKFRKDSQY